MERKSDVNDGNIDLTNSLSLKREDYLNQIKRINDQIKDAEDGYKASLEILNSQKKPLEEAIDHIEALLKLEGHDIEKSLIITKQNPVFANRSKEKLTDLAFQIMYELHQPIHYKELALKLQNINIYIPGKNGAATLLSRICRDSRFKRTRKRGVYALAEWKLKDNIKKRRKHKRNIKSR
jgi:hypothetical protein